MKNINHKTKMFILNITNEQENVTIQNTHILFPQNRLKICTTVTVQESRKGKIQKRKEEMTYENEENHIQNSKVSYNLYSYCLVGT